MSSKERLLTPGVLLSELFKLHLPEETHNRDRLIVDAVEQAVHELCFTGISILPISDEKQKDRLGHIAKENDLRITVWFNPILAGEGLNLSSLDESLRKYSVRRISQLMDAAVDYGAEFFGVCSGPDPGPQHREEALTRFIESLGFLCRKAGEYNKRVILEPLDRGAHKNGLIGPVREAAAIAAELETEHNNFSLCWDTAHAVLCGDTLYSSLREIFPWMSQIHLSNAVLDPRDPLFGDYHMEIGRPGFLDIPTIKEIIQMVNVGISTDVRKGYADTIVTVEVRTPKDCDPWVMMDRCHEILEAGGLG
jgi:sugar phosphate isomerase/epimerase